MTGSMKTDEENIYFEGVSDFTSLTMYKILKHMLYEFSTWRTSKFMSIPPSCYRELIISQN